MYEAYYVACHAFSVRCRLLIVSSGGLITISDGDWAWRISVKRVGGSAAFSPFLHFLSLWLLKSVAAEKQRAVFCTDGKRPGDGRNGRWMDWDRDDRKLRRRSLTRSALRFAKRRRRGFRVLLMTLVMNVYPDHSSQNVFSLC